MPHKPLTSKEIEMLDRVFGKKVVGKLNKIVRGVKTITMDRIVLECGHGVALRSRIDANAKLVCGTCMLKMNKKVRGSDGKG